MHFAVDGGPHEAPFPPTGTYATADGLMNVSVIRDKYFRTLCGVLGVSELSDDPRYVTLPARRENEPELRRTLEKLFAARNTDELVDAMREADMPHAKVNTYMDAATDPHVEATSTVLWAKDPALGRIPVVNVPGAAPLAEGDPRAIAPSMGGATREVLADLGYDANAIEELLTSEAVA